MKTIPAPSNFMLDEKKTSNSKNASGTSTPLIKTATHRMIHISPDKMKQARKLFDDSEDELSSKVATGTQNTATGQQPAKQQITSDEDDISDRFHKLASKSPQKDQDPRINQFSTW
mmetsp:Transcript_20502/g.17890  ORF Transcript_20502/g.17890 Transcript_20502/m.17890 type:complete len:116 (+) Transcript_20502:1228-1575(+)